MAIDLGMFTDVANALTGIFTGASNTLATANLNKKNREFVREENEKAYKRQLDMWNRTNAYNAPQQVMQRYIEAGLNPNLIYKNGTSEPAKNVTIPQTPTPQQLPITSDLPSKMMEMQALSNAKKQGDLLSTQTMVQEQQALKLQADRLMIIARIPNIDASTRNLLFDLAFKEENKEENSNLIHARRLYTETLAANQEYLRDMNQIQRDLKQRLYDDGTLMDMAHDEYVKLVANINYLYAMTYVAMQKGRAEYLDNAMREKGINPHDPMWIRVAARLFDYVDKNGVPTSLKDWFIENVVEPMKIGPFDDDIDW